MEGREDMVGVARTEGGGQCRERASGRSGGKAGQVQHNLIGRTSAGMTAEMRSLMNCELVDWWEG